MFKNVKPEIDKASQNYTLKYSDRVIKSSIKGFQVIRKSNNNEVIDQEDIFVEFGKISQNEFSLSLRWPLSIITAFSLAISAFE